MELITVLGGGHYFDEKLKKYRPLFQSKMRSIASHEYAKCMNYEGIYAFLEGRDKKEPCGGELMAYYFKLGVRRDFRHGRIDTEQFCSCNMRTLIESSDSSNLRFGSHTTLGNFSMVRYLWPKILEDVDQITIITNWFHGKRSKILAEKVLNKPAKLISAEELLEKRYERHKMLGRGIIGKYSLRDFNGFRRFIDEYLRYFVAKHFFEEIYVPVDYKKEGKEVRKVLESLF